MTDAQPQPPAPQRGAPHRPNVPRMEDVRAVAPDPERRATLERMRERTVIVACGFTLLFAAVSLQLTWATIISPHRPRVPMHSVKAALPGVQAQMAAVLGAPASGAAPLPIMPAAQTTTIAPPPASASQAGVIRARRAMITDRNGEVLALSVPTYNITMDPRALIDADDAARQLKNALPGLNLPQLRERLADPHRSLVYVARNISVREQAVVAKLRLPGLVVEASERRSYPFGRAAAHVLGGVGAEGNGVAGVEMQFNDRLLDTSAPLRLSVDTRVQAVVREELDHAINDFNAIGGCGQVMDVRTGEVIAMVSLPDYKPGDARDPKNDAYLNRCSYGRYEPGSTFKLQTAAMALDSGAVHIWNGFDASSPIHVGRFTINDFEGKHRWLAVPEIIAYSSNIGAARMAEATGTAIQRAWMEKMGMMTRTGIELPETRMPEFPPVSNWKESATFTVAFGHGISVTPLHVVAGTAAVANGGVLMRPTLLAVDPAGPAPTGVRVMQQSTSDTMRKLMRLVVTDGFGKSAEVPGYYVGGKTGTAEKNKGHGYTKNARVSAFMSVFPMNAPRYAVYMMLDEPKANAATHGYATAGWVAAPAAGRVIERSGPLLGMQPDLENAKQIAAQLAIPLQPSRGSGPATPPPAVTAPAGQAASRTTQKPVSAPAAPQARPLVAPPTSLAVPAVATAPMARDLRQPVRLVAPKPEPGHAGG